MQDTTICRSNTEEDLISETIVLDMMVYYITKNDRDMKMKSVVSWDITITNPVLNETGVIANCSKLGDALFLTELLDKHKSYAGRVIKVEKKYTIVEDETPLLDKYIKELENEWNEFKKNHNLKS